MGFLDKAFRNLGDESEIILGGTEGKCERHVSFVLAHSENSIRSSLSSPSLASLTMAEVIHYGSNATRWEKTVVATDSIVNTVNRFDPDGIEIVCVGGASKSLADAFEDPNDGIDWHTNIMDSMGVEEKITKRIPGGPCPLGKAMDQVLTKAMEKDLSARPCAVLVLTAGKPDDSDLLEETLKKASQDVADRGGIEKCPISITFVQIGKDEDAEAYLNYLDKKMVGWSEETETQVDIVDTMGFQELKSTVDKMKEETEQQAAWYAIHKKFFHKMEREDACDYVLVLDRSRAMEHIDRTSVDR